MGKGSNVQKANAARERNQKKAGKSDEERKAASAKVAKDSAGFVCKQCRMTFMINVKLPTLYLHCTAKHAGEDAATCFDQLVGFDPNDPEGKIAAKAAAAAAGPVKPKKVVKKKDDDLLSLLDVGLGSKKKSTKKK